MKKGSKKSSLWLTGLVLSIVAVMANKEKEWMQVWDESIKGKGSKLLTSGREILLPVYF
jgi:hypothetical protein